jgi:simple sugar transport system permease protein
MDGALLALILATVRLSTPLVLASMGELVAERSGVLNIGIEGLMLTGAFAGFAVGSASGSAWLGCAAGALAGAALASVFAYFAVERGADPIVCGTALNIFALGATGSAYRLLFPPTAELPLAPRLGDVLPGVNGFVLLAVLLALGCAVFLARTRPGLALRAVGERAEAAHAHGVQVLATRWAATLFGGACAGLAGTSLVLWISDGFVEGMTSGRGFIALALVLFGGYRPARIAAGALLFGFASALQFRLQAAGLAIPYNLLLMVPYVLTLLVLALFTSRATAPADLARPFTRRR